MVEHWGVWGATEACSLIALLLKEQFAGYSPGSPWSLPRGLQQLEGLIARRSPYAHLRGQEKPTAHCRGHHPRQAAQKSLRILIYGGSQAAFGNALEKKQAYKVAESFLPLSFSFLDSHLPSLHISCRSCPPATSGFVLQG